ncbi:MAG: OmpA/MotB domain-containing protein [Chitinophagaceae bacterium]|nr:MAG: OmpA/MotB domain-containing protein [Chitinophagaceae bacterium]
MYFNYNIKTKIVTLLMLVMASLSASAQTDTRTHPNWWFGVSGAANFNNYQGTTQKLNNSFTVPAAFHQGKGTKPYGSFLLEYRPKNVFGFMLNLAYDNRGGKFNQVIAPCNCPADLNTNLSYAVIEPSLRIAPFSNTFYLFVGPTFGINISRSFQYIQDKQPDVYGEWSDIRKTMISAQAGLGIDIPLSKKSSETQMTLSPFASFQTNLLNGPRSIENWTIHTVRAGIALKFGTGKKAAVKPIVITNNIMVNTPAEKEVQFSVRAPKFVPNNRNVKETFPIRKEIFFDMGSSEIPGRYVQLNKNKAASFTEQALQEQQPDNLNSGRAARQMHVYHNILNILGDRMRSNPGSTIVLTGASSNNPEEGKLMADNVKNYLVNNFLIDGSRIGTEGRDKPLVPSEQPGGTKELELLRIGDRRVDITSNSPEMILQVGGANSPFLKPVQIAAVYENPLDSHVIFTVERGNELLKSWNVEVTDEKGAVQYYGPYTQDQATVPGKTILGNQTMGNYKIVMKGKTKTDLDVKKESSVSLMKAEDATQEGLRYSIMFDFNQSKTLEDYEQFLTNIVAPLIKDNATVIVHGHTDIIGDDKYNLKLSGERAKVAQKILERALSQQGKKGVKYETYGFGEDETMSPFDNNLPEERFYNRTVIIDIINPK